VGSAEFGFFELCGSFFGKHRPTPQHPQVMKKNRFDKTSRRKTRHRGDYTLLPQPHSAQKKPQSL